MTFTADIRDAHREGLTDAEIAERHEISLHRVRYVRGLLGLTAVRRPPAHRWVAPIGGPGPTTLPPPEAVMRWWVRCPAGCYHRVASDSVASITRRHCPGADRLDLTWEEIP